MTTLELQTGMDRLRGDLARLRERRSFSHAHEEALALQASLDEALRVLDEIRRADKAWRAALAKGEQKPDPTFAEALTGYYRDWDAAARQRLAQIDRVEARGIRLDIAGAFRQAAEEVQDLLEERSWAALGRRARALVDED